MNKNPSSLSGRINRWILWGNAALFGAFVFTLVAWWIPIRVEFGSDAPPSMAGLNDSGGMRVLTQAEANRLVQRATKGKARVYKTFEGPGELTGLILGGPDPASKRLVGWTDGTLVHAGPLLNEKGVNLTKMAQLRQVSALRPGKLAQSAPRGPQASLANAAGLLQHKLPKAESIAQFSGTRPLYVFYDPDCPYCKRLYEAIQDEAAWIKGKDVMVQWIPVAILGEASMQRAQAHMRGGLSELKTHFGGKPSAQIHEETLQRMVQRNTTLLRQSGGPVATPTLVYQNKKGIQIRAGAVGKAKLRAIIRTMTGGGEGS